jgi:hypothetical protein
MVMPKPLIKRIQKLYRERVILCRRYPIAYVNVPKSACTTIKNIMYFLDTGEPYPDPLAIHADKTGLRSAALRDEKELAAAMSGITFCFTFVREPFARSFSAFNEKIFHQEKYSFPRFRDEITGNYGANFSDSGTPLYSRDQHADNFQRFLTFVRDNVAGRTQLPPNRHWIPQSAILGRWRRSQGIDFVGRVEKFEDGMNYVLAAAGYPDRLDLPVRYNPGPKPPFTLNDVMNNTIGNLLHEIYESDLREFRYK